MSEPSASSTAAPSATLPAAPGAAAQRTRIKICGLTREADVDACVAAGADAVGFVLYERSKRAVTPERAAALARRLPPFVTPVLLFVNWPLDRVRSALDRLPMALAQFHGDEAPALCEALQRPYLRAVSVTPQTRLLDWAGAHPHALALLVDTPTEGYGGSGKVFDWSLLHTPAHSGAPVRLVLSGGLRAANVAAAVRAVRPLAVDVASGVEAAPGVKDAQAVHAFCAAVRAADAALQAEAPPGAA